MKNALLVGLIALTTGSGCMLWHSSAVPTTAAEDPKHLSAKARESWPLPPAGPPVTATAVSDVNAHRIAAALTEELDREALAAGQR